MNSFIEVLNHWSAGALGVAWQMFWQSSLLIAVVFLVDLALRRRIRTAVRYALWLVVLAKLMLPPALALPTAPAWWILPNVQVKIPETNKSVVITYLASGSPTRPAQIIPPTAALPPRLTAESMAVVATAFASLTLLLWLIARWFHVARDVRQAEDPPEILCHALAEAGSLVGLDSPVRLKVTRKNISPAVCGLFRAVILLPEVLVQKLPPNQMRAVLVHELIHVKRRDVWMNCLQTLLQIVYWWHPLVWLANARIRRAREEAVDDAVMMALRAEADCYAPTLLEVAKLAFHLPLASLGLVGILESRSALRQRIERLVEFTKPRRTGLSVVSILGIAAFAALAVPMGQAPEGVGAPAVETNAIRTANLVQDGKLLLELGNLDQAAAKFQMALKLDPANPAAHFYSSLMQKMRFGNWGSTNQVGRVGADYRSRAAVLVQDGKLFYELGKLDESEAKLRAALKLDKANQAAYYYLNLVKEARYNQILNQRDVDSRQKWVEAENNRTEVPKPDVRSQLNAYVHTNRLYAVQSRQTIQAKLQRIRLETVGWDGLPLSEVVRKLSDEALKRDPEKRGIKFVVNANGDNGAMAASSAGMIDPATGLPNPPAAPAEQVDLGAVKIKINPPLSDVTLHEVLDAIVKVADRRIQYSIGDNAVVFWPKRQEPVPLYTRIMKLDPAIFVHALAQVSGLDLPSNAETDPRVQAALATFVQSLGVDMTPPKMAFFNDREGTLMVHATLQELDTIEQAVELLSIQPPEVNIRARFIEMPRDLADELWIKWGLAGNPGTGSLSTVLSPAQAKELLSELQGKPGLKISDASITTLSGRQTEIQIVNQKPVVVETTNGTYETTNMSVGPVLDVVAMVSPDGRALQIMVIPTVAEFLGFDDPGQFEPKSGVAVSGRSTASGVLPLPHFRLKQVTTSANVWDGQTLLLDGLNSADSVALQSGVPVLGDLPLVGPLFKNQTTNAWQKSLIILVTPTIIDASGQRIHKGSDSNSPQK